MQAEYRSEASPFYDRQVQKLLEADPGVEGALEALVWILERSPKVGDLFPGTRIRGVEVTLAQKPYLLYYEVDLRAKKILLKGIKERPQLDLWPDSSS